MGIVTKKKTDLMEILNIKIEYILGKYTNMKIILGGDFNLTINDTIDRWPAKSSASSNATLTDFMYKRNLTDIWRLKNPNMVDFTWGNKTGSLKSRIDLWLISDTVVESTLRAVILPAPLSDHKVILLEVVMSACHHSRKNTGYWKLNNSLLTHTSLEKDKINKKN